MFCGMICLMAPALRRISIMLGIRSHLNFVLFILARVFVAMSFDLITRRRVHPAVLYVQDFGIKNSHLQINRMIHIINYDDEALEHVNHQKLDRNAC